LRYHPDVRALVVVSLLLAGSCSDDEVRPVDAARSIDAANTLDAADPDAAVQLDAAAACAGMRLGGACWYQGALGESCTTVCTAHGGFSPATITYAGAASAGDRSHAAGCSEVAAALSVRPYTANVDNVNETNDYGCVEEPDKNRSELVSLAATVAGSANAMLARFCACLQ
jgi:hypothetical protein